MQNRRFPDFSNKLNNRHGTLWGERFKIVIVENGETLFFHLIRMRASPLKRRTNGMVTTEKLIQRVQKTKHGFLDIQKAAYEIIGERPAEENLRITKVLFVSEIYQARSLATFMFGRLAANSDESLDFLKRRISNDNDWRVQEILAKAFGRFCADTGFEIGPGFCIFRARVMNLLEEKCHFDKSAPLPFFTTFYDFNFTCLCPAVSGSGC